MSASSCNRPPQAFLHANQLTTDNSSVVGEQTPQLACGNDEQDDWTDFVAAELTNQNVVTLESSSCITAGRTSDISTASLAQDSVQKQEITCNDLETFFNGTQADNVSASPTMSSAKDSVFDAVHDEFCGKSEFIIQEAYPAAIPLEVFLDSAPIRAVDACNNSSTSSSEENLPSGLPSLSDVNATVHSHPLVRTDGAVVEKPSITQDTDLQLTFIHSHPENQKFPQGFDGLDDVQRYAVGALTVVLLSRYARDGDLNGAAFAATQGATLLNGLGLRPGQQTALLALDPDDTQRETVMKECVSLIGDHATRFAVVQAMLAFSIASGVYDARSRALLTSLAFAFAVDWQNMAAVELAVAIQLLEEAAALDTAKFDKPAEEHNSMGPDSSSISTSEGHMQGTSSINENGSAERRTAQAALASRRKKKFNAQRAMKVSGITLVGGILFGVTGGLIAPALLSALAGVGVASAATLAATGATASSAVVGSLFGVAGAGLSARKARRRIGTQLDEFDFERSDDPRVIEARKRAAERKAAKARKAAEKAARDAIAVDDSHMSEHEIAALPPITQLDELDLDDAEQASSIQDTDRFRPSKSAEGGTPPGNASHDRREESNTACKRLNDHEVAEGNFATSKDRGKQTVDYDFTDDDDDDDESDDDKYGVSDDSTDNQEGKGGEQRKKESSRGKKKTKKFFPFRKSSKRKRSVQKRKLVNVGARGLDAVGQIPSLHVCICVPGWLHGRNYGTSLAQFEDALKESIPCSQHVALRWESSRLYEMSLAFAKFWASKATITTIQQAYPHAVAAASTVAGAVAFAFAIPLTVVSCMDYIDNPWSVLLSRSNVAGEALADVLVERSYGQRPVTLVGYSLGARVVFKCLESLASRNALGIVDNVFLLGAPVSAEPERWRKIVPVVAGRIVNGYLPIDWALAFFHRGCGHGVYVAGLRRIAVEGIENLDLSMLGVDGHRELKDSVHTVLRSMGLGTGFIAMPPAPLIPKKDLLMTQEEEAFVNAVDSLNAQSNSNDPNAVAVLSASENCADKGESLLAIQYGRVDSAKDLQSPSPTAKCAQMSSKSQSEGTAARSTLNSKPSSGKAEELSSVKNSKKRSWFPSLSSWSPSIVGGSAKQSGLSKSKNPSASGEHSVDSPHQVQNCTSWNTNMENDVRGLPTDDTESEHNEKEPCRSRKSDSDSAESSLVDFDEQVDSQSDTRESIGFDWDLQRRIWEEQERQLRENGIPNAPVDRESCLSVVLNISVEVTGRRLKNFIPQDAMLPVKPVTEVYTNCVDEQLGVMLRLYEHEKGTKTVPLVTTEAKSKYPKFLGEIMLKWRTAAPKGKMRIALTLSTDDIGNVIAKGEIRSSEGVVLSGKELFIQKNDLCTLKERRELEAAAAKRSKEEATASGQDQVLMLPEPAQPVLALPAPSDERCGTARNSGESKNENSSTSF